MRKLIGLVVVVAFGVGVYLYLRSDASERVKSEMLKLVDDISKRASRAPITVRPLAP